MDTATMAVVAEAQHRASLLTKADITWRAIRRFYPDASKANPPSIKEVEDAFEEAVAKGQFGTAAALLEYF